MANVSLIGSAYDAAGVLVAGTANVYARNTETPVLFTMALDGDGRYTFDIADGRYDVEVVVGTQKYRRKYDDAVQLTTIETRNLRVRNPANTFKYDIVPAAITADRTLNLPLIVGTDTLVSRNSGGVAFALFIGDTSNANMTTGVTINQGAATDEAVALKGSGVAHGVTTLQETDTYFAVTPNGGNGGAVLRGIVDTGQECFLFHGVVPTKDTTKSTVATAPFLLRASLSSGTGTASIGADGNLVVIQDNTSATTRFIFDAEGSAHADVEWIAFDQHDDLTMVADLERELVPQRFGEALTYNREALERAGIIGRGSWHEENGQQHAMINFTRLAMLHHGALNQVSARLQALEQGMLALKQG